MSEENVNYLKLVNDYKNNTESYFRHLEELLWEFEEKYGDPMDDDYFIEPNENWYLGIITMDTNMSLNKWFNEYHKPFTEFLDLKLIRVTEEHTINTGKGIIQYKVDYTYRDNVRFEELDLKKLEDIFL